MSTQELKGRRVATRLTRVNGVRIFGRIQIESFHLSSRKMISACLSASLQPFIEHAIQNFSFFIVFFVTPSRSFEQHLFWSENFGILSPILHNFLGLQFFLLRRDRFGNGNFVQKFLISLNLKINFFSRRKIHFSNFYNILYIKHFIIFYILYKVIIILY